VMLKQSWTARKDNDEIRTLLCQSLISFVQWIIDKEMLSASCIDEYEVVIDECVTLNQSFNNDQAVKDISSVILLIHPQKVHLQFRKRSSKIVVQKKMQ
ncbi:MAG: hypothetical protein EZS28_049136, partial [Streblomastix strix]